MTLDDDTYHVYILSDETAIEYDLKYKFSLENKDDFIAFNILIDFSVLNIKYEIYLKGIEISENDETGEITRNDYMYCSANDSTLTELPNEIELISTQIIKETIAEYFKEWLNEQTDEQSTI